MCGLISEDKYKTLMKNIIASIEPAQKNIKGIQNALKYYSLLVNRFPDSKYGKIAIKRMISLKENVVRNELFVAALYFRKESYIATVNRLQYLITNYSMNNIIPVALALLSKTYSKMNLVSEQNGVKRILVLNFKNINIDLEKELNL
jgi:outer membrane protein assembly factor BamD